MNYYKRHIGDYAKKAGHLSTLEHGVYTLLLDAYYDREQAPTKAEAIRQARARTAEELAAVDAVLGDFFTLSDDGRYTQTRVEEEFVKAEAIAKLNAVKGSKGGRPRKPKGKLKESRRVSAAKPNESPEKPNPLIHQSTNPPTSEQEPAPPPAAPLAPAPAKPTRASKKPPTTPLPDDFAISERVRKWAAAKGHHSLETHFESFVGKCRAKGYTYLDWDEAFMEAVRGNWANVGAVPNARAGPPAPLGKTAQAINQLQAMKNELAQDRTADRLPETSLLGFGPDPSFRNHPGND